MCCRIIFPLIPRGRPTWQRIGCSSCTHLRVDRAISVVAGKWRCEWVWVELLPFRIRLLAIHSILFRNTWSPMTKSYSVSGPRDNLPHRKSTNKETFMNSTKQIKRENVHMPRTRMQISKLTHSTAVRDGRLMWRSGLINSQTASKLRWHINYSSEENFQLDFAILRCCGTWPLQEAVIVTGFIYRQKHPAINFLMTHCKKT